MVAKVIHSRKERGVERDAFYVKIGGFDTHSDEGGILTDKMQKIDAALAPFIREMEGAGTPGGEAALGHLRRAAARIRAEWVAS